MNSASDKFNNLCDNKDLSIYEYMYFKKVKLLENGGMEKDFCIE
ncbi:hypothetical protein OMAG_001597, partial [Candidatus Omnitrophus magneticus]